MKNIDQKLVNDFGNEWDSYKQNSIRHDLELGFNEYFHLMPEQFITSNSIGFDAGCGSGRWAKFICPKIKQLNCIEPSQKAINVAKNNLNNYKNCVFENCSVNDSKIPNNSQDFGYCLGVLHHIPDTESALDSCVKKLKKNSPLLLYLYYRFDNKPYWYKKLWQISDKLRNVISKLPFRIKLFISVLIAFFVYLPLVFSGRILTKIGINTSNWPLIYYKDKSIRFMMTDALDKFGTRLEKRYTKKEIIKLMENSGLTDINFSNRMPYWVAIGFKK